MKTVTVLHLANFVLQFWLSMARQPSYFDWGPILSEYGAKENRQEDRQNPEKVKLEYCSP